VDAGSEELIGDMSNAINSKPSPKTKISQKDKTLYFEKGNV
jgi:hypothetical protein